MTSSQSVARQAQPLPFYVLPPKPKSTAGRIRRLWLEWRFRRYERHEIRRWCKLAGFPTGTAREFIKRSVPFERVIADFNAALHNHQ
jgi:hypothetical protein